MNSISSPGTLPKWPAFHSALACSMRSLRDDTKFHQMWRGPSIGAPPTMTKCASLAALEFVAGDVERAADHVNRALLVAGTERDRRSGLEMHIGKHGLVHGRHRRRRAVKRADHHTDVLSILLDHGEFAR